MTQEKRRCQHYQHSRGQIEPRPGRLTSKPGGPHQPQLPVDLRLYVRHGAATEYEINQYLVDIFLIRVRTTYFSLKQ